VTVQARLGAREKCVSQGHRFGDALMAI
jgi:hypothetical protein